MAVHLFYLVGLFVFFIRFSVAIDYENYSDWIKNLKSRLQSKGDSKPSEDLYVFTLLFVIYPWHLLTLVSSQWWFALPTFLIPFALGPLVKDRLDRKKKLSWFIAASTLFLVINHFHLHILQ